jgi:flavin-dependent dehydrogenase
VSHVDIAIIGGGPAGAAAALTFLRYTSQRVAVVEKSDYSQVRVGETVPPSIQPLLGYIDVWEAFQSAGHLRAFGNSAAWGSTSLVSRSFMLTGRGDGWHLDRARFDRSLIDAVAERGGTVLRETQVSECEREGDEGWRLQLRSKEGAASDLRARFVIDASGHNAVLARATGAQVQVYDQLVGIVGFFDLTDGDAARTHNTLIETCPDGWWYWALLPGGQMVATFMTDADMMREQGLNQAETWLARLGATQHIAPQLAGARVRPSLHVRPAYSRLLNPAGGHGWIAAGDAAASFDPLASMGIGHAITSGIHAARAAHDQLTDDGGLLVQYREHMVRNYDQYLQLREQFYQVEQRWADQPFWARRHG